MRRRGMVLGPIMWFDITVRAGRDPTPDTIKWSSYSCQTIFDCKANSKEQKPLLGHAQVP